MPITTGQKAPDFALWNTQKNLVKLSDLQGKNVLLLFFPLAFTGVCTKELCEVRDNISFYNNVDAEVFGISVDALPSLKVFKEQQNLSFELLCDFNKEASNAYEAIHEVFSNDMKGVSKRSAFVIDKDGIVQYAEVLENPGELPDFKAINAVLEKIK